MATIITNNGNIQTAGALNFAVSQSNNLKVDGLSAIYLTGSNSAVKVGINTINPNFTLDVNGNTNIVGNLSASGNITATSFTGSFSGSINNAVTASYALTASLAQNLSGGYVSASGIYSAGNTVVGGNLVVSNNLTVLGTSSVVNITSSDVTIGTNKIVVNAYSPFQRYAGLSAVDSGSGINVTSSLYWDSLNNYWLFQGESGPGQLASSSIIIGGPIGQLGSEATLTVNTIPKAVTDSNIGDSKLTDDGTTLAYTGTRISASSITASAISVQTINVSNSISGASFTGSFSGAFTGPVTGSLVGTASWANNALTASYVTASNIIGTVASASYSLSSSFATTASFASSLSSGGSYTVSSLTASNISASGTITSSNLYVNNITALTSISGARITGSFTGSLVGSLTGTASWANNALTASYITASNIVGTVASASYSLSSSFATTASFASSLSAGGSYIVSNLTASNISASGTITSSNLYVNNITALTSISGASVTGSFTGSLVGSLTGTASWATNALTASYITASNIVGTVVSASYARTSSYSEITNTLYTNKAYQVGSLIVGSINIDGTSISSVTNITSSGTISAATLVANDISGGIGLISGSNIIAKTITGSFTGSLVGSLTGTASWANNSISSSYSLTSSYSVAAANAYIQNGNSFGTTANLGTNDNNSLVLETNNTGRVTIDTSGGITSSAKIVPASDANSAYTLGTTANRWNDIYAVQSTIGALFETGLTTIGISRYKTGTVLSWKDKGLIPCEEEFDEMVMGVAQEGKDEPIVFGAEPILVTGKVNVGDYIVTSNKMGHGMGIPRNTMEPLQLFAKVIAQAVESGDGESYTIKAMIRKM